MTEAKHKSEDTLTKEAPYLALTGKLWGVHCEDLGENWQHYNGTTLYIDGIVHDGSNSSVLAMELLPSYTMPSIYTAVTPVR